MPAQRRVTPTARKVEGAESGTRTGDRKASVAREREMLVRRGLWLNYGTIAYNCVEAIVALGAGFMAGSVALVGFGFDSVIEVTASGAAQWRLRADRDAANRQRSERRTLRVVGWSFIALALYIVYDSATSLWQRQAPERSTAGIVILMLSLVVMPLLARAKQRVARALGSNALSGEATQTSLCAYLSAIALGGIVCDAVLGWWWADPVAALCMIPIIWREGVATLRGDPCCDDNECGNQRRI